MKFLIIANKKNELQPDIFLCDEREIRLIPAWACEKRYDTITIKIENEEEKYEEEKSCSERPTNIPKNRTEDSCY